MITKYILARLDEFEQDGQTVSGGRALARSSAIVIRALVEELHQKNFAANRAGQVSEDFRKNPASRNWETSYTRHVFSDLLHATPETREAATSAALDLLYDYHESQHIVYEQRDAARAEAEQKNDIHAFLRDVIVASVQSGDRGAAIFALAEVDAKRLHDVKPERYLDFIKALLKRTGEATAKKLLEKAIES
jgi:hypothetical protein